MRTRVPAGDAMFAFGPFLLIPAQRTLLRDGQALRLGGRALRILTALVEHAGQVLGKAELMAHAWPELSVDDSALRFQVSSLRKMLGDQRSGANYIANVPARGYCFVGEVTRSMPAAPASLSASMSASGSRPRPGAPRLIGRDPAIGRVVQALETHRMVTIAGMGGMGKTSVAQCAATRLAPACPGGVHVIDLAAVADPALVPGTAAAALGVPAHSTGGLGDLASWQGGRPTLVVIDNCEHLREAVARLAESLLASGGVRVLATSREPVGARGEHVERLSPLPCPPSAARLGHAASMAYPAFELFVDRASASFDGVSFTDANAVQVAALCEKLDGLPLAIELVAAQCGFYGLAGLNAMIDGSLSLSAMSRRTAPARHQTLRSMLDWSFQLLEENEQLLLCRLSVFSDAFSLESAIAVSGELACETAEALATLVDKSLVCSMQHEGDAPRYRLLATTRSYAAERLAALPDHADAAARHLAWCIEAVQLAALELEGRDRAHWRERHCRLVDEVRTALAWAFGEAGDAQRGTVLVVAAAALYGALGIVREHVQWLERAVKALPASMAGSRLHAQLLLEYGQARLAIDGSVTECMEALEHSAGIAERRGDSPALMCALSGLFNAQLFRVDYRAGLEVAERFGRVARAGADGRASFVYHRMMALGLHLLGRQPAAMAHSALALQRPSQSVGRLHGDQYQLDHWTLAMTQHARMLWLCGRPDAAMQAAADAVRAASACGHLLSLTYALVCAACPIAIWRGDMPQAGLYVEELQQCVDSHALTFWQAWPQLFRAALSAGGGDERPAPLPPMHAGQRRLMSTFDIRFADIALLCHGDAGGDQWCEAELLRLRAEHLLSNGPEEAAAQVEALLFEALALAEAQGARAWVLRCATSLGRLLMPTRPRQARQLLAAVLEQFDEGAHTRDVRDGQRLLQRLDALAVRPARLAL